MKKKVKQAKPRAIKIGGRNFLSSLSFVLAFILFIPIVLIGLQYLGFGEQINSVLEPLHLQDIFTQFVDKVKAPEFKMFNIGYFAFACLSFVFLILFAPKKATGNAGLYTFYMICTFVCVVHFALSALFPEILSLQELWMKCFEFPAISTEEIIEKLTTNTQFIMASISVLAFAIATMIANAGRNRTNFIMNQECTMLKNRLAESGNTAAIKRVKKLKLKPTYWTFFLLFLTLVLIIPIFLLTEEMEMIYVRIFFIVTAPFIPFTNLSAKKAILAYRAKYANIYKDFFQESYDGSPAFDYMDTTSAEEKNRSMFWMREARFWHNQAHKKDECFEGHYTNIFEDVPKNK